MKPGKNLFSMVKPTCRHHHLPNILRIDNHDNDSDELLKDDFRTSV